MLTSSHEVENSDTIQVHESHTVKLGFFFFSFVSWFSLIGHMCGSQTLIELSKFN